MTKSTTKTFVIEFETGLTKADRDLCEKKLRVASSIYNACLREAKKRYEGYKADEQVKALSKEYVEIKKVVDKLESKKKKLSDAKKTKTDEYKDITSKLKINKEKLKEVGENLGVYKTQYSWGYKYCMNEFIKDQRHHFKGAIGAMVVTTLANRAVKTIERHDKDLREYKEKMANLMPHEKKPKHPKVIFVKRGEDYSFEGADNESGIYYKDSTIAFKKGQTIAVNTSKIESDPYYAEAMKNRIKFCRLISRTIRGKKRYYVQLCMEGVPPKTKGRKYGNGEIKLDVKTKKVIFEKGDKKTTIELAPGCKVPQEKMEELDRKIEASRRANNPQNYNEDGTVKPGKLTWYNSKNYEKLVARKAEISRKVAETRKISHEILANTILSQGTDITVKKLSFKKNQKRATTLTVNENTGEYKSNARQGKNIADRAPGEFVSILQRKVGYIGKNLTIIEEKTEETQEEANA